MKMKPSRRASSRATLLFPDAAGPSMAITRPERRSEACGPICTSTLNPLAFLCWHRSERADYRRADLHPFRVGELLKHRFESRIRFTNTFRVLDDRLAFGKKARHGKGHRDAMIAKAR